MKMFSDPLIWGARGGGVGVSGVGSGMDDPTSPKHSGDARQMFLDCTLASEVRNRNPACFGFRDWVFRVSEP